MQRGKPGNFAMSTFERCAYPSNARAHTLVAGIVTPVVHSTAMTVLLCWYAAPWLATCLGCVTGLVTHYFIQRKTLVRHGDPHHRVLSRFISNASLLWAVNLLLFTSLHSFAGASAIASHLASCAVIGVLAHAMLAGHQGKRCGPLKKPEQDH